MKYIFITGGVLSGLGKGITAASIGTILKARGFSIYMQKCDQYLNVDAGTLNPGEHGEVFVTEDGAETDLDLGHYERFIDVNLSGASSVMTGDVYNSILEGERRGDYLGKTIQVIPHVTDKVKDFINKAAKIGKSDIMIIEIGGTVGDYEGLHFLEASRQLKQTLGPENVLHVHVGYLPYLKVTGELKTKPMQNSIRTLQSLGIQPDIVVCRADYPIDKKMLDKVSLFGGIKPEAVIGLETVGSVYQVPLILEANDIGKTVSKMLKLPQRKYNLKDWENLIRQIKNPDLPEVKIAIVGKYMTMKDTYYSVIEAIKAASYNAKCKPKIKWVDSEKLESQKNLDKLLGDVDAMVVPGGFGGRGIEGKIKAAQYARENKIPYLGLCLGLQMAVIEFARNVCKLKGANSTEFAPKTKHPVIFIMPEQKKVTAKGGTMRLGSYPCRLNKQSKLIKLYGNQNISERHRHRFEVNPKYIKRLEKCGLLIAGLSPNRKLVEFIEILDHPYFVATQAHPEFKSRPNKPHPLFKGLIKAAIINAKSKISPPKAGQPRTDNS